jgi:uncharacterized protein (TIGR03066 family)
VDGPRSVRSERPAPDRKSRRPRRRKSGGRLPPWLWLAAGASAGAVLVLVWGIWRATNYGSIRIEVSDTTAPVERPKEVGEGVNRLSRREKADGWKLLFDGQTTAGWRGDNRQDIAGRWRVADGALVLRPRPGPKVDLVTEDEYDSFELVFQWWIAPGGNSGVLYHVAESADPPHATGPEYQVIDTDEVTGNSDRRRPETTTASCYALYGPSRIPSKPAGEWNDGRILVSGNHVEHWLNGARVVEYEIGSPDWQRRVQASKFRDMPRFAQAAKGRIDLQDNGAEVAYRNLKIRPLPPAPDRTANKEKIIGVWVVVKMTGIRPGTPIQFTRDGKLITTVEVGGQKGTVSANYEVDGDKLTIINKVGDTEFKAPKTIRELTDKKLIYIDPTGVEQEFRKK